MRIQTYIAVLLGLLFTGPPTFGQGADAVYLNGRIYTVNASQVWADAVAVTGEKIVFVGDDAPARLHIGERTRVIDLEGKMVMPGIHDAHTHLLWAGLHLNYGCQFPEDSTVKSIISKLRECARGKSQEDWLVAGLFYSKQFPNDKPHKSYLDEAFPDRPVYLREGSFHHALLNSKALEMAGIDRDTTAPFGGKILKDANGELTGELVETATLLADPYLPKESADTNLAAMHWAVSVNNEYGITSVQDASAHQLTLETLRALENEGGLTLQVAAHLIWGSPKFGMTTNAGLEKLIENRRQYQSRHVNVDFIKIWVDGSPTPPYFTHGGMDWDSNRLKAEQLLIPAPQLNEAVSRYDAMGLKVKLHVAGAGAARAALDAIEAARRANPKSSVIHELGHTNLVTPDDMPRFKRVNAIAEMSPSVWHIYGRKLGNPPKDAWEFKTLLDHGALMTFGTDWVVTPTPNVFPALEGMLDRGDESIDLVTALQTLTINGALSLGWEQTNGSIEPGKYANFIVLDRNLFEIPVGEISETRVLKTVFEGKLVYQATVD